MNFVRQSGSTVGCQSASPFVSRWVQRPVPASGEPPPGLTMQTPPCAAPQARPLFGGSLSAVIPPCSVDTSELREIPDNQEVFAHAQTDQSLIIELVEYQAQVEDQDAARYHFEDIAGSNKASEPEELQVLSVEPMSQSDLSLSDCSSAWILSGSQLVSKFNEEAKNVVNIHLAVLRLPQFTTEILISFNDPQSINPSSSSAASVGTHSQPWTLHDFHRLLQSLTLHDPGLFG